MGKKRRKTKRNPRPTLSSDKNGLGLRSEVQSALKIIRSHNAVIGEACLIEQLKHGGFIIKFEMHVELPSRLRKQGVSPTGVKAKEPVLFYFPSTHPFQAPKIMLRPDFNRSLPHIHPLTDRSKNEYVEPCVYNGNLDDLLHQKMDGLKEILNHLSEWFGKAAINDLIDPNQGWEPIRRDDCLGWIVFDLPGMRNLVKDKAGALAFPCRYWQVQSSSDIAYFVGGIDCRNPQPITSLLTQVFLRQVMSPYGPIYGSLVIMAWSDEFERGKSRLANHYLPETILDLQQLYQRAEEYGCLAVLRSKMLDLSLALKNSAPKLTNFPLFIILCARRPYKLIGDDSALELIPYVVDCHVDEPQSLIPENIVKISPNSPVGPLGHRHALTGELLRKMSGGKTTMNYSSIVQIGCGSVGSKITMHLARSGLGPFHLIDKSPFSPHNAARNALTIPSEVPGLPKASMLAYEVSLLGQHAEPICADITNLCKQAGGECKAMTKADSLIIDSTGSLAVREMLSTLSPERFSGRLFHTALYEGGKIGIIAVEGFLRNPSLNDIALRFWDELVNDNKLAERLNIAKDAVRGQQIGQGCDSHTMIMSDSRVSLFAAGMAERVRHIIENGAPASGELWIGLLDDTEMGVTWRRLDLFRTTLLKTKCKNPWKVRILGEALIQINQEAAAWDKFETGGVLIGRISLLSRLMTISRVIEAPPDSERSENYFILGNDGLKNRIQGIYEKSGHNLNYVGTWHSHPRGGGHSNMDLKSLEKLKKLRLGIPAVGLIKTPAGLTAIIDEG